MTITKEEILKLLEKVSDPEIPVINIVEMGIVREVKFLEDLCEVKITPTYSGCPAMHAMEQDIIATLNANGIENVNVKKVYNPAWTTDWLNETTREKLKNYGIAPPVGTSDTDFYELILKKTIACPFCNSTKTKLTSEFGSTSCKSLHYCDECCQPFEHFKCI